MMLRRTLCGLLAVIAATSVGLAQSAYGIKLPIRGADEAVPGPHDVEAPVLDEPTGIDKVEGRTIDFAASGAAKQAAQPATPKGQSKFRRIDGAAFFEDRKGGAGLMVTGAGSYSSDGPSPDAIRMARRSAYVAAYADAMRLLTENVFGASLEQKIEILKKLKTEVADEATAEAASTSAVDAINEKVSGLIRGVQIWKCMDEGANVRVWLFLTRESASACRVVGSECKVGSLAEFQAAVDSVVDECMNGFLPPIGGKCIIDPKTGIVTFVGFGSAIIKATTRGETGALKAARLRAKAGLVGIMTGQQVDYSSQLTSQESRATTDYHAYVQAQPPAGAEADLMAKARSSFKSIEELSESLSLVAKGKLPPGTQDVSFVDNDTGWVTAVYIYSHGSDALVGLLRSDAPIEPASKAGIDGESPPKPVKRPTYDPSKRGPSGEGRDARGGKR